MFKRSVSSCSVREHQHWLKIDGGAAYKRRYELVKAGKASWISRVPLRSVEDAIKVLDWSILGTNWQPYLFCGAMPDALFADFCGGMAYWLAGNKRRGNLGHGIFGDYQWVKIRGVCNIVHGGLWLWDSHNMYLEQMSTIWPRYDALVATDCLLV